MQPSVGCACARSCGSAPWRWPRRPSGRTFGLHDWRFLASEIVLLASMFVISHYVLPLLARRDRGATGEEHVGGLLDCFCDNRWFVIHDAIVGRGNIDHIVIGPAGVFTVETKSHPGADPGLTGPRGHDRAGSRPAAGGRTDRRASRWSR